MRVIPFILTLVACMSALWVLHSALMAQNLWLARIAGLCLCIATMLLIIERVVFDAEDR